MNKNLRKLFISVQFFAFLAIQVATVAPAFADTSAAEAPPVVAPGQPVTATTGTTAVANAQPPQGSLLSMLAPFGVVIVVMYFFMIRPQQKKMKDHQSMLGALKEGDEVVTSAGIIGKIAGMNEKVVTLEVSKNVQLKVVKSQISNKITQGNLPELPA